MSCLSLGNCGSCWESPCVCHKASFSETVLECLRTDELVALQAKISALITKRSQSITYSTNTVGKVIDRSHHSVVQHIGGNPFDVLTSKHKD